MSSMVVLLFLCGAILTQSMVSALQTNVGREFIFGYTENYRPNADPSVIITNMSPLDHEVVTVNISTPVHGLLKTVHLQGFDSSEHVTLPRELVPYGVSPDLFSIIVRADDDIAVYAINDAHDRSMDGFTVLPLKYLGTEYFAVTYEPSLVSQMLIISIEFETTIKIHVSNRVTYKRVDVEPGRVITIDARKYEGFLLESDADLTGTRITSNKPIAVITGNRCAFIPVHVLTCDHLAEMVPPFNQWGKTFVIMPFLGRSAGDIYRVIAGRDGTEVIVKSQKIVLDEKKFKDFNIMYGQTSLIQSNKPVLVVQYAKGFEADNVNGDPSMTVVPPMEQGVNLVKLPTYNITKDLKTVENYVNIYALCAQMYYSNFTMDGMVLHDIVPADRIIRVDRSDYCAVGFHLSHGIHTIAHGIHTTAPEPRATGVFVAIAYGFAERNSYAWPAALATSQVICEYVSSKGVLQTYDCSKGIVEVQIPCNATEPPDVEMCTDKYCITYDIVIFICAGVAVAAIILQNLFSYFVIRRTSIKTKNQLAFGQTGLPPPEITIGLPESPSVPDMIGISQTLAPPPPSPSNQRRTSKQERADRMRRPSVYDHK